MKEFQVVVIPAQKIESKTIAYDFKSDCFLFLLMWLKTPVYQVVVLQSEAKVSSIFNLEVLLL